MDGPAGVKKVAGTGTEQPRNYPGNRHVASNCDAESDAISPDRIELLAQAVAFIAVMAISEDERVAVLARLTAASVSPMVALPTGRATIIRPARLHGKGRQPMTTVQEIEKAIEALPLADQLRLYRDLPHLIGSAPEELDWQRLAIEEFFKDDSPDDSVYDSIEGWGSGVRRVSLHGHAGTEAAARRRVGNRFQRSSAGPDHDARAA